MTKLQEFKEQLKQVNLEIERLEELREALHFRIDEVEEN